MRTTSKSNTDQVVLITGASTGIGYATAIYLCKIGMKVYAGIRKESDKQKLISEGPSSLTPVFLDVCDQDSISKSFDLIAKEIGDCSFNLINNAGLSLNGPLEILPMSDIIRLLDVNVRGLLSVTKTFLPLIRKNKGRIVNISSGHGLLAVPDKSVYAASKFAVNAISDSLRVELRPFGVMVSSIVVGKVNTKVLDKILVDRKKMLDQTPPEITNLYLNLIEYFDREVKNIPGIEAIEVAKVIAESLSNPKPKVQYLVGPGAKKMKMLACFPTRMRDNMMLKAINK
ncbi:SDR family NAD(P)-dependent oxidoreductase [Bacteroidota bacterium]